MNPFFGKYRGKVVDNLDPLKLGRVQVSVPAVYGDGKMSWAMPCVPYAGNKVGLFAVPPKNANIWVEFEGGNIDYPIWTGCFWNSGEVPQAAATPSVKVFRTEGVELVMNDTKGSGGVTLKVTSPAVSVPLSVVIDSNGLQISTKTAKVKVSPKAIEVTLPPGSIRLASSIVETKHGGASVSLQQAKVAINKSALEVI